MTRKEVILDKVYWRCYASIEEQEEYECECKADETTACDCPGDGSCCGGKEKKPSQSDGDK